MTTHYGWENGRTLCGQWRGLGARWTPGSSTGPPVDCPACIARNVSTPVNKRMA